MEADVAIQRAPEKWATGEPCIDQPQKVAYVYGGRKKDKLIQGAPSKHFVKPSRSYDNELGASVVRDADNDPRPKVNAVKDDLTVGFGSRSERHSKPLESSLSCSHDHCSPYSVTGKLFIERSQSRSCAEPYGLKKEKYQPKFKSVEKSPCRSRQGIEVQVTSSQIGESQRPKASGDLCDGRTRPIPVEFHLKADQIPTSGPAVQCKRPIMLSSPLSSVSSSFKEKPSSLVILEVKDGPTFFYRPSDYMVSDSGMGDDSTVLSFNSFSPAVAGLASSRITQPFSLRDHQSEISSNCAYIGSSPFSTATESSPLNAFRKDSSMGLQHVSLVSIANKNSPSEGSPRTRSSCTQLPRTPGLRKPDLSVLSTPPRNRANILDEDSINSSSDILKLQDKQRVTLQNQEPFIASAASSATFAPTLPISSENLSQTAGWPSASRKSDEASTTSELPEAATSCVVSGSADPQECVLFQPMTEIAFDSSSVFQNTSEIMQQKAGIKHDDIIVGPRRPKSGMHQGDFCTTSENSTPYMMHAFPGSGQAHLTPKGQATLSVSTDGLYRSHQVGHQKRDYPSRRHTQSESDFPSDYMAIDDTPKQSAVRRSKGQVHTSKTGSQNLISGDTRTVQVLDHMQTDMTGGGLESDRKTRSKATQMGYQKSQQRKKDEKLIIGSGSLSDFQKSEMANAESPREIPFYICKSLDRSDETKLVSKSANVSPAKQQLHNPKSKSSTSTPTKKQSQSSKLHTLPNIPVAICHDPPAKRISYHRPLSSPDPAETTVPSLAEEIPEVSQYSEAKSIPPMETVVVPSTSTPVLVSSDYPPLETLTGGLQNMHRPAYCSDGHAEVTADFCSQQSHALLLEAPKLDTDVKAENRSSNIPTEAGENLPSTAMDEDQNSPKPLPESPCHVPVKPRLHRSAEHLSGDAKLAVFDSSENVQLFESPGSSSKMVVPEQAKMEKGDSISPLKKNHGLAKIGVMRRGSDRTEMCRRGSERIVLPVNQNDPSVEDLKKATSLRELCQSMASLLNIDNVKAAEMLTTSLSQRQDLVEGLDADAIMDYLSHHGVLDPAILVGLSDKESITQRNSAILRHVEEHGNTAVALFINALRQSGQLHLASSLDTEQRIKPVSGNGYFGKDRHKGELTIRVEIEALKIIAPREPRHERIVDQSLLGSPDADNYGVVIRDAAEEEDFVKPRSCWCFCFSRKGKAKSASKKDSGKSKKSDIYKQGEIKQYSTADKSIKCPEEENKKDSNVKPHRTKSQEKNKKGKESFDKAAVTDNSKKDLSKTKEKESHKKSKSSKSKSKVSGKGAAQNKTVTSASNRPQNLKTIPDVFCPGTGVASMETAKFQHVQQDQSYNGVGDHNTLKPDKDSWDPIIMEYDPKLELVKLRAGQEELASPTRQSGNIGIMCEQWKSNGRHFQQKALQLCDRIIQELHTEIIKYFEQDRGTLVLDVVSDGSAILIINICMMQAQVRRLQQEIADESLLNRLQDMFFSRVDIAMFDIRGLKMRIVLDEQEVLIVLSELS